MSFSTTPSWIAARKVAAAWTACADVARESCLRGWRIAAGLCGRLRRVTLLELDQGGDAGKVRAQQLRALHAITPHMMAVNLANAGIILALSWKGAAFMALSYWALAVGGLSLATAAKWLVVRRRPVRNRASVRAIARICLNSAMIGSIWGAVPLIMAAYETSTQQLLAMNAIVGISAGGAFALAAVPAAAITYLSCVLLPPLAMAYLGHGAEPSVMAAFGTVYFLALLANIHARYRDLSFRIRDQARIEKQKQTISLLLRDFETSASDWLWEVDRDGRLTYVSDRLAQVTGAARDALVGEPVEVIGGAVGPDEREAWALLAQKIKTGHPVRDHAVVARHGGSEMWWCLTAGPMVDDRGTVTGFRGVGTDISERKRAEIALDQKNQLLATFNAQLEQQVAERTEEARRAVAAAEEASRAKSRFVANMSHEIRTPMNGVFGMADLLMRTELTDRQKRLVHTINQSASSLLTIINDILDISRIEAGRFTLDHAAFDIRAAIEEVVDLLAESAQRKRIEQTLFIAPDVPAFVKGDAGRVRQICTNIVSNAIKFTPSGSVRVSVSCPQRTDVRAVIEIKVRDTGIGMPPAVQERLFQPFQQADTSITRRFGGTGLGLAITKHLLEMAGGTILLDSTPGVGTEFTMRIPFDLVPAGDVARDASPPTLQGVRVLVLDDRAVNREIMASYLAESGADVTAVETADAAMSALKTAHDSDRPFSVALIDMVLPGSSGLAVAASFKAEPAIADLHLILVTSMSWKDDFQTARKHGFEAFLAKPIHRKDLTDTVLSVLGARRHALPPSTEAATSAPEAHAGDLPARARRPQGARVLIAEDNPVNIEVAREYLSSLDCAITLARTGVEAVAAYAIPSFDIILMDCQMPEMDGLAATAKIREAERLLGLPRRPIIAVTANAYEEDRERCIAAGMDDYLSKPFTEAQLHALVAKWVEPRAREASSAAGATAA